MVVYKKRVIVNVFNKTNKQIGQIVQQQTVCYGIVQGEKKKKNIIVIIILNLI
jgi:hypothetical protein